MTFTNTLTLKCLTVAAMLGITLSDSIHADMSRGDQPNSNTVEKVFAQGSRDAKTRSEKVSRRFKVAGTTVSVSGSAKARRQVMQLSSKLQRMSGKQKAAFSDAVASMQRLRSDADVQQAARRLLGQYGGLGATEGIKITIRVRFKPLELEIIFETT